MKVRLLARIRYRGKSAVGLDVGGSCKKNIDLGCLTADRSISTVSGYEYQ